MKSSLSTCFFFRSNMLGVLLYWCYWWMSSFQLLSPMLVSSFHMIDSSTISRSIRVAPSFTSIYPKMRGTGQVQRVLLNSPTNDNFVEVDGEEEGEGESKGQLPLVDDLNTNQQKSSSLLSCRILGFYPFPTPPPKGPLGWLLKDTHQAIMITSTSGDCSTYGTMKAKKTTVLMDFMTKGGASHPVWYDEFVKWKVFLGGSIEGEVRMKVLGAKRRNQHISMTRNHNNDNIIQLETGSNTMNDVHTDSDLQESVDEMDNDYDLEFSCPSMKKLMRYANSYNCEMNLYGNNCRMFAARMEREVQRINMSYYGDNDNDLVIAVAGGTGGDGERSSMNDLTIINLRCTLRILGAALLPAIYPLGAILLLYEGYWLA